MKNLVPHLWKQTNLDHVKFHSKFRYSPLRTIHLINLSLNHEIVEQNMRNRFWKSLEADQSESFSQCSISFRKYFAQSLLVSLLREGAPEAIIFLLVPLFTWQGIRRHLQTVHSEPAAEVVCLFEENRFGLPLISAQRSRMDENATWRRIYARVPVLDIPRWEPDFGH